MKLDDLDRRLLDEIRVASPRPAEIPFCDYDVDRDEMVELCTSPNPHDNHALITTFACHNRWGMFGDWTHFPPFAGHVAVSARRRGFDHEHDLAFYHLHTAACGHFAENMFPLISDWATDILEPWHSDIKREELFGWEIHAIGYLGIYCNVGGDPADILRRNIEHSFERSKPTEVVAIIHDHFLANTDSIYEHFSSARRSCDNQQLPAADCRWVAAKHVKAIHAAIEAVRMEIESLCLNRHAS